MNFVDNVNEWVRNRTMDTPDAVAAIRRFNRFYTRAFGFLQNGHLGSAYSLAETRVLYELGEQEGLTPKAIVDRTGIDRGYVSRIVARLEGDGLVTRTSARDGRTFGLMLSDTGDELLFKLRGHTVAQVEDLLASLTREKRRRLVSCVEEVETLLGRYPDEPVSLRSPDIGDLGWVVQRHGIIYAREYGWDERFEALCARIAGEIFETFDPSCERGWIAERGGVNMGCVFLQKAEADSAKLRLLLVEPSARGLGLGKRLIDECVSQAREFGYKEITLWTQSILAAARRLYTAAGFEMVDSWPNREFKELALTSEKWCLKL